MFNVSRSKCKKCEKVFELTPTLGVSFGPHIGPYRRFACPACGKGSRFNVYSSVKDPVTWPPEENDAEPPV